MAVGQYYLNPLGLYFSRMVLTWHNSVYKLRCKVAQPGTTITPPASPSTKAPRRSEPSSDESSYDEDSNTEDEDDVEFIPEECLFCNNLSTRSESNLAHMCQAHSLTIPYASSLTVDIQTVLWFLHMVIYQYRECICCGKRKRSIEAVQAHMISTGHCRFDINDEMERFYDMETLGQVEMGENPDEQTLRLPSGKLLGHRNRSDQAIRRPRASSPADQSTLPASKHQATSTALATKKDRKDDSLAVQLSGLRKGDQMSLMHLSAPEQRSLLARHKKELDKAKRVERKKRSKLDRVGDKVAVHVNYYKQEVPIYSGG